MTINCLSILKEFYRLKVGGLKPRAQHGETKDLRLIENNNIYQIKYLNEIPKEKELLKIINDNKIILLKTDSLKLDKE